MSTVVGVAVVLYVFVDFFAMIQVLPGQPEQDGSNFYFNNKGSLIPISADIYRMGLMHAARLFSGHELFFFGFAALLAHQIDAISSGRIAIDLVPRDEMMERSRLPYPLQRVVTLRTALTPEACAARLMDPRLPNTFWSFLDSSRGLQGDAYAVGRFEADGGGTSIRLLLTFKRWPLIAVAAAAILIPLAWAAMAGLGFPLPRFVIVFLLVFGVVGNFLFGLDQRRRLLAQIKRAIDAPGDLPLGALAFEADHGDEAIGPPLVVGERRPDLRHLRV